MSSRLHPRESTDAAFTIIATGAAPVVDGVLGRLDPTLLINDQYTLRLTVFDRGDNQTTTEVVVQVARNMKIGNFTLSFEDVAVPLDGIPLGVNRNYDSRDKRTGDFGVGWRLDLQSIRIRTNRILGTGWERIVQGPNVSLTATDAHKVTVTLPGDFVEQFDLAVSPTSNIGSLDFTNVIGFPPRPGTLGLLESLENPGLFIVGAGTDGDALVDDSTLGALRPAALPLHGRRRHEHRGSSQRRRAEDHGPEWQQPDLRTGRDRPFVGRRSSHTHPRRRRPHHRDRRIPPAPSMRTPTTPTATSHTHTDPSGADDRVLLRPPALPAPTSSIPLGTHARPQ